MQKHSVLFLDAAAITAATLFGMRHHGSKLQRCNSRASSTTLKNDRKVNAKSAIRKKNNKKGKQESISMHRNKLIELISFITLTNLNGDVGAPRGFLCLREGLHSAPHALQNTSTGRLGLLLQLQGLQNMTKKCKCRHMRRMLKREY